MIQGNTNFEDVIGAMYYLDLIISGMVMTMSRVKVNEKWYLILKHLFDVAIQGRKQDIRKYDDYIYSTFECSVKYKRRLWLIPRFLSLYCNIDFINLIMGQLVKTDHTEDITTIKSMVNAAENTNLPKKEALMIFENVKELFLSLDDDLFLYIISLSSLLSIIKLHPSIQVVLIELGHPKYNSLVRSVYYLSKQIRTKYKSAGYDIQLKEMENEDKEIYINCVIERECIHKLHFC